MAFDSPAPINRRTVAKGIAWSVPAVAVAGAAPAFAASKPPIEIDFGKSTACKIPGSSFSAQCYDKGYVLWGVFTNNTTLAATVTITGITVGGITRCIVGLVDYTDCKPVGSLTFTIPAMSTRYIAVYTNSSTDSSSTTVTVSFDYTLTGQPKASSTQSGSLNGQPWQGSCNFPANAGAACNDKNDLPLSACNTSCSLTPTP